jgi:hypothetical protein
MSSLLLKLIGLAVNLVTHIYDDVEKGDPVVKDIEAALASLKSAQDTAKAK